MKTNKTQQTPLSHKLFGTPTPQKTAGLVYSFAAILPTVAAFLAVAVFAVCGLLQGDYASQQWFVYFNFLLPQACFALTAFLALRYSKRPFKQTLQSQKCPWRYFLIALLMQVGLFAFSELNTLFLEFLQGFGYTPDEIALPALDGWGFVGALIAVAVLPAVFEEILFRGILLNGIKPFGEIVSALLCGALFALYHQNPPQTVYQFICGTAFAFVALRAGSILPTILAHFLNNAFIVTLYKLDIQTFSTPIYVGYIIVSILCFLAAVGLLVWDRKKTEKPVLEKEKGGVKTFFKFAAVGIAVCALTWTLTLLTGM